MGAYENPQIIQQPDYGQIFLKNFQAGFAQAEAAKQRAEDRRQKQKNKDQRLADKELAFAMKAGEIEAGDLTADIQNFAYKAADSFSENERLWADNKISRDVYSKNRASAFRKLQELNSLGKVLQTQSENYDNLKASGFQKDPRAQKLIEAWENKQIKFKYIGDDLEVYFKDGDRDVLVDINDLKKGDFFNVNEKYKLQDSIYKSLTMEANVSKKINNRSETDANGNIISSGIESYNQDKSVYINQIATSSKMAKLFEDAEDAGSLFVDDVHASLKDKGLLESTANELIKKHNIKDPNFKEAFINNTVYNNPKYKDILDGVSKNVIANRAFDNYLPANKQLKTPVSSFKSASPSDNFESQVDKVLSPLITGKFSTPKDVANYFKEFKFNNQVIAAAEPLGNTDPEVDAVSGATKKEVSGKIKLTLNVGQKGTETKIIDLNNINIRTQLIKQRIEQLYPAGQYRNEMLKAAYKKLGIGGLPQK